MSRINHNNIEEQGVISHKDMHGIVLDFGPTHFFPAEPGWGRSAKKTKEARENEQEKRNTEFEIWKKLSLAVPENSQERETFDMCIQKIEALKVNLFGNVVFATDIKKHIEAANLIRKIASYKKKGYAISHKEQRNDLIAMLGPKPKTKKQQPTPMYAETRIVVQVQTAIKDSQANHKVTLKGQEETRKEANEDREAKFENLACFLNLKIKRYMKPIGNVRKHIYKPKYDKDTLKALINAFTIEWTAQCPKHVLNVKVVHSNDFNKFCKPIKIEDLKLMSEDFPEIIRTLKMIQKFLALPEQQKVWKGTARLSRNNMIGAKYLWNKYMFEYSKCTQTDQHYKNKLTKLFPPDSIRMAMKFKRKAKKAKAKAKAKQHPKGEVSI